MAEKPRSATLHEKGTVTFSSHHYEAKHKGLQRDAPSTVQGLVPDRIREVQTRESANSAVFATYLMFTKCVVGQWEHGEKRQRSDSVELLTLVAKNGLDRIRMSAAGLVRRRQATETVTGDGNRSVMR